MDCSLPGSSVHGIFQAKEYWSGLPLPSPYFLLTYPNLCSVFLPNKHALYSAQILPFLTLPLLILILKLYYVFLPGLANCHHLQEVYLD